MNLDTVTLSCVVGKPEFFKQSFDAVLFSSLQCKFKKVQLLSCVDFEDQNIDCIKMPEFSFQEYNKFMIEKYDDYVQTEHVLHIQYDGFVLKGKNWKKEFLEYDYIGALWPINLKDDPQTTSETRVGNGGFTLRSKKLLSILKKEFKYDSSLSKYWNEPYQEDSLICRKWKKQLEDKGIKFAPPEIAAQFSIEYEHQKEYEGQSFTEISSLKTFGFHNKNLRITKV